MLLSSWKLKRPQIQLRPHHFWTYTSNLTTVVNSVLKFMIKKFPNMCSNIPASPAYGVYISQLIRYGRASCNYSDFLKVIFIWETGYWTRASKRFALIDLLKSLYSDTKILSKYILSLQRQWWTMDFHEVKMHKDNAVKNNVKDIFCQYVT